MVVKALRVASLLSALWLALLAISCTVAAIWSTALTTISKASCC